MNLTLTVTTPTDREIVITRSFSAPQKQVWDAMVKPDLLRRWLLGPPGWKMDACENDVRVGGRYVHTWTHENGQRLGMSGEYREVVPGVSVTRTEKFDMSACPGEMPETIAKLALSEAGGKTTVTITLTYPTRAGRDGALQSGMTQGMEAGYARLDDLLK